jgi:hypothetical protein
MSVKGFESLSTEHAAKLEAQKRVEKMVERKELSSQARSEFESKASPSDAHAVAKALASHKRPVGRPRTNASSASANQSPEHELKLRQSEALARYSRYFNSKHPALREACGSIAPNSKWSAEEAESHLDRVRAALAEDAADETFKNGVVTIAKGAEWVTMTLGVNPARLDLKDFGEFVAGAINSDALEPELSEGRAECGSLLTAPWQARLLYKVSNLALVFNESKKRAAPPPIIASMAPPPSKAQRVAPETQKPSPAL